jgi:hypothetical protein
LKQDCYLAALKKSIQSLSNGIETFLARPACAIPDSLKTQEAPTKARLDLGEIYAPLPPVPPLHVLD